ncbi:MAG: SIMPL domain-containing protein [Halodesulfurarchaeum sp.]
MHRKTLAILVGAIVIVSAVGSAGLAMAVTGSSPDGTAAQTVPTASTGQTTITVSATGTEEAQPDKALLRLSVEATSPNATTARTQVAENVSEVRSALKNIGIDESNIRTTDYNIYRDEGPRPVPPKTEEQPAPVFRARHGLLVEISDIDKVGRAIDVAVDAGATNVRDVQFTLSTETRQHLRLTALEKATANARSEAETLASASNLQITGVHTITTQAGYDPSPRYEVAMAYAGGADTSIESGPVTVSASVTITYNATQ